MKGFLGLISPGWAILALSLVVAGYLLVSAGGNVIESFRLADDEARLRAEVEELHSQERQLEQIRAYLRTDDYIEFMARRVFGLVKPGEYLVIVQAPRQADEDKHADGAPALPWWERLFGR